MEPDLRSLHAVARALGGRVDAAEILQTAVEALPRIVTHELASIHLLVSESGHPELARERGLSPALRTLHARLTLGEGQIGGVAATGATLVVKRAADDPALPRAAREAMIADGLRGLVCVAIHGRDRVLGTLTVGRRTDDPFTDAEVALIEATADTLGFALDAARLHAESERRADELRHARDLLVSAERLSSVGQLASGVAHDINNPLTTILGQAHLLLAQPGVPQSVRDRAGIIAEETARAARLVQNLLIFARQYPPERRPCLLQDQIGRVLELKTYQLQQDAVEVVTELCDCDPVSADEHQLQQVLLSLVQNAHRAMQDAAGPRVLTVRLTVEHGDPTEHGGPTTEHGGPATGGPPNPHGGPPNPQGPRARIAVLDTGPGISADALPRIFEPFFSTRSPGERGGLGLSVARGVVAEHQGRLWAENRPDGGAAFFIELPLEH
jgi:signal transduction histidine kinase